MHCLGVGCGPERECLRVTAAPSLGGQSDGEITYLFVYGGLMRGFDLHHYLAGSTFVDTGWTEGLLVEAGRYPGLIDGRGKVFGELYTLHDPPANLEALDELEDFDPTNPQASTYLRTIREVHLGNGSLPRAWVYSYNRDVNRLAVIESGDWHRP